MTDDPKEDALRPHEQVNDFSISKGARSYLHHKDIQVRRYVRDTDNHDDN